MAKKGPLERHTDEDDRRYLLRTWVLLDRGRHVRTWEYGEWHSLPVFDEREAKRWSRFEVGIVLVAVILTLFGVLLVDYLYFGIFLDIVPPEIIVVVLGGIVLAILVRYMRRGSRSGGPREGGYFRLLKMSMRLTTRAVEAGLRDRQVRFRKGSVHERDDTAMRLFRFEVEEVKLAVFVHEPTMTSVVFVAPWDGIHGHMVGIIRDSIEATVPLL